MLQRASRYYPTDPLTKKEERRTSVFSRVQRYTNKEGEFPVIATYSNADTNSKRYLRPYLFILYHRLAFLFISP